MALPCIPDDAVAKQIIDSCAAAFAENSGDCNKFLKAALLEFLVAGYLDNLDADGIVGKLQSQGQGWTRSRDIGTAITKAKSGNVVVAGMTSTSLGQHHGHVAVVVGCDGQPSGGTIVPVGYAGSLESAEARIEGAKLSWTFAATLVQSQELDYYFKAPDRTPA
jgi:hypothetical protein